MRISKRSNHLEYHLCFKIKLLTTPWILKLFNGFIDSITIITFYAIKSNTLKYLNALQPFKILSVAKKVLFKLNCHQRLAHRATWRGLPLLGTLHLMPSDVHRLPPSCSKHHPAIDMWRVMAVAWCPRQIIPRKILTSRVKFF